MRQRRNPRGGAGTYTLRNRTTLARGGPQRAAGGVDMATARVMNAGRARALVGVLGECGA